MRRRDNGGYNCLVEGEGGVRRAPADRGKQERKNDWGFRVVAALAVGVSARFP